jgi:hypothetical protein
VAKSTSTLPAVYATCKVLEHIVVFCSFVSKRMLDANACIMLETLLPFLTFG